MRRVNRERDIVMLKFLENPQTNGVGLPRALGVLFGSAALIALVSATPIGPAAAQGVPAGLLRLDPPQPSNNAVQFTEQQRSKIRSTYAHSRKIHVNQ
jgi:hypothetical protein